MSTTTDRVRQLLGEDIPVNGSDTDTLFLDEQIEELISSTSTTDAAVAEGWRIKAAKFAGLVDTAEGTSKRSMSDLHKHALSMVAAFGDDAAGARARTRIHKIVRD